MSKFRALLKAALLLVMLSADAESSPLELYGFGGRSSSMAGAGVATCSGFGCVYLNPAGLGRLRQKQFAGGYTLGDLNLTINGNSSSAENTKTGTFALILPLRLGGRLQDRMTLALGILVPRSAVARARAPKIGTPNLALLDSRSEVVGIQVALGYAHSERWSFGAGVLVSGTLQGTIQIDVDGAGRFITRSEQELKSDFSPIIGARYQHANWQMGLSLRGESQAGFDITISNDLAAQLPLSLPELLIVGTPQYDPAALSFEVGNQIRPDLGISLQLDYKRWSAFPLPTLNPIERSEPLPSANFRDTVVPRLAIEWTIALGETHLATRAGYAFLYSPAPKMSGQQSLLDNHRHLGSAGLGFSWPSSNLGLHVDLWMQIHHLMPRSQTKEPAVDPQMSTLRSSGTIRIGGVTVGVDI